MGLFHFCCTERANFQAPDECFVTVPGVQHIAVMPSHLLYESQTFDAKGETLIHETLRM